MFHGWQLQPNATTVQEKVNAALSTVFRQPVESLGCGRTDAGVHALQFYAHFDLRDIPAVEAENALHSINALLPYQIAVHRIFAVAADAHARFDATQRSYIYKIHRRKDPFLLNRSWLLREELDIESMNRAAAALLLHRDFSCFSKSNTQTFTNNCILNRAEFVQSDAGYEFHISADRFLRNMVRAIVGTLVDVGRGVIQPEEIDQIVESKNRSMAGQSVPACGLYLSDIQYPYI